MLLRGLTWLVLFQLLGSAVSALVLPMLPGPIIGLLLLFVFLLISGEVRAPLQEASTTLLRYLPLLLVPPAVGIIAYVEEIQAQFWGIVLSLSLSLVVSVVFTGWLMQRFIQRQPQTRGDTPDA